MTDQATPLTQKPEALVAKHERGEWTEEGWSPCDDGYECRSCGVWCDMPEALRAIEAAAARRAIEGSGVMEARRWVNDVRSECGPVSGYWYDLLGLALKRLDAILAALPRPEEPRVERCVEMWSGVVCGRTREEHAVDAALMLHPFTTEAR